MRPFVTVLKENEPLAILADQVKRNNIAVLLHDLHGSRYLSASICELKRFHIRKFAKKISKSNMQKYVFWQ